LALPTSDDARVAGAITTDAIRLHRLVREVAAAHASGAREDMRRALVALDAVYPGDGCAALP
jgi:hypothetical protein